MQIKSYTVVGTGFLFGDHYKDGQTIMLNEKQARRFVDEGRLKPTRKPATKSATDKAADTSKSGAKS